MQLDFPLKPGNQNFGIPFMPPIRSIIFIMRNSISLTEVAKALGISRRMFSLLPHRPQAHCARYLTGVLATGRQPARKTRPAAWFADGS